MPLIRALAKNMAPMTNTDESPTNRLTLFPIYLSLFIVSTLWQGIMREDTYIKGSDHWALLYLEKARQSFFSQTAEAKNMADFLWIWRHFTPYPWQRLMLAPASQAQFWAAAVFTPSWICWNNILIFAVWIFYICQREWFLWIFRTFTIYSKIYKLFIIYLAL